MDIAALSMVMSQSRVQKSANITLMKMAMNAGKENAAQIAEMIKDSAADPNLVQHLDTRA